jgi:hypothetical protein
MERERDRHWWLRHVILATQVLRRQIEIRSQPGQIAHKALSQKKEKKAHHKKVCWTRPCKTKKKRERKEGGRERERKERKKEGSREGGKKEEMKEGREEK